MNIKIGNFGITHAEASLTLFDVYEKRVTASGKNVGEEFNDNIAFGVTMPRALNIILTKTLDNELDEVTLKEYSESYKKTAEKVLAAFEEGVKANLQEQR